MNNQKHQSEMPRFSAIGMITMLLCASFQTFADENQSNSEPQTKIINVIYADPVPNTSTPCDGGIGYQWTVNMMNDHKDTVQFIGHVGAKSWNEPPPSYEPPFTGWTHTSNWVALEIKHRSKIEIIVDRQQGVAYRLNDGEFATARDALVPALSVFKGWQTTGCDDHRYNNAGNIDWMTEAEYIGNAPNTALRSSVKYRTVLEAGKYSIAIGGSPKELEEYPANNCDVTNLVCYSYTGRHGYEATITATPLGKK